MKFEIVDANTGNPASNAEVVSLVVRLIATGAAGYFLYKYVDKLVNIVDPTKKQKKALEEKVSFGF